MILITLQKAVQLIIDGDAEIIQVVWASLRFSVTSTVLASLVGVPLGILISRVYWRGKGLVNVMLNTLLSIPTVVIGLLVYSLLSRRGPLGELGWLFSSKGIILGQVVLILPLVTALVRNAVYEIDQRMYETAISLGATSTQKFRLLLKEAQFGILGAVIAAYGRVIGEVGISMMLGGNIKGNTRTITTAIALETSKGGFSFGMALGLILVGMAFLVNIFLYYFQAGER